MSKTRKVVMMNEAGRIWTEEQETPAPKPGQLLIEVRASMVSPGTELGGVKRRRENPGSEARQRSVWIYECRCCCRYGRRLRRI